MLYPSRSPMKPFGWVWLFLFAFLLTARAIQPVPHVIQVSVDGLGAFYLQDYVREAPEQFPAFCRLMTNGAYTFNARCDYLASVTMPNHTCMLTGRPVYQPAGWANTTHHGFDDNWDDGLTLHVVGNLNVPYKASVMDVVHDHGLSTAFYASKSKFDLFTRSYNADNGAPDPHGRNKVDFSMVTFPDFQGPPYYATEPLVDSLVEYLNSAPWNYAFIHFSEPDYNGHILGGWGSPAYSNAVRHVDQQLMRIFEAIDANPELSNQVALVLTADHGGSLWGHGDYEDPLEYTLPMFVWGPGIPAGTNLYCLFSNRFDPGAGRVSYSDPRPPLWNGDSGNIALALLGLPPIPGSSLRPQLVWPNYRVEVRVGNNTVTVSWPAGAAGYVLEAATDLQGDWTEITSDITTVGDLNVYTNIWLPGTPLQFYRLRNPNP